MKKFLTFCKAYNIDPPVPASPITPAILRQIRALWSVSAHDFDTIMLWSACTLCFFGFFRIGEITASAFRVDSHLGYSDLAVDDSANPTLLRVHLKVSKTDQFRRGMDVFVGSRGNDLCPVSARCWPIWQFAVLHREPCMTAAC